MSAQVLEPLVSFLRELGAGRIAHSKRSFLDHLVGTAAILEHWGMSERVRKAGLFHSIYGTGIFRHAVLSFAERPRVTALLGEDAERLAFAFCALDRASIFRAIQQGQPWSVALRSGGDLALSPEEAADLVALLWANELEQLPFTRRSDEQRAWSLTQIALCAPHLPPLALSELLAAFGSPEKENPHSMWEPGIDALFNVDDISTFLNDIWPHHIFRVDGPVERLAGLVDYSFSDLVDMQKASIMAHVNNLENTAKTQISIRSDQAQALYDAGATIYFHDLKSPRLTEWVNALNEALGLVRGATLVSAFASRRGRGLPVHFDHNDNFVCQARGSKRFRMAPNDHVKNPTTNGFLKQQPSGPIHRLEAPNGYPEDIPAANFQIHDLLPGSVVFMPRGTWHDTETIEQESLHFNIQCGLPIWKDLVEYLVTGTTALYADELREPIVHLFRNGRIPAGFQEDLREKLRMTFDAILDADFRITAEPLQQFLRRRILEGRHL